MDDELTSACGADPSWICQRVFDWTGNASLAGTLDVVLDKPVTILLIVLGTYIVVLIWRRIVSRLTRRLIAIRRSELGERLAKATDKAADGLTSREERAEQRAESLGAVGRSIGEIVIVAIAIVLVLGELGVAIGPLIAGAGLAGVAVGFGAQSLVKDFFTGMFLATEDQFGVGDVIDVGLASGTVERMTLRTTWIRDVEGTLWVVPNGEITHVGNKSQLWARTILDLGIAYDADIDRASAIIKGVADDLWREADPDATVIEEPEVWGVEGLGASEVTIRLAVKTDPSEQWAVARRLRQRIKEALDAAGIEIPFPQRTVWVHQE